MEVRCYLQNKFRSDWRLSASITAHFGICSSFARRVDSQVYAEMLAQKMDEHKCDAWLLNTGSASSEADRLRQKCWLRGERRSTRRCLPSITSEESCLEPNSSKIDLLTFTVERCLRYFRMISQKFTKIQELCLVRNSTMLIYIFCLKF